MTIPPFTIAFDCIATVLPMQYNNTMPNCNRIDHEDLKGFVANSDPLYQQPISPQTLV